MNIPSFKEDHISQLPALKLLMTMGWKYLSPEQALEARGGRTSNVLLESVLKSQLQAINKIEYKQKEFPFSEANINNAILALRDLPIQDGFIAANNAFYQLITLGKSFEQTVLGDKKSFSFQYIDWNQPENNVYHVTEEFSVLRSGRSDGTPDNHYRPDIVLFINGIPMVIIECKSPRIKQPVEKAIEQNLRNQQEDGIRSLYLYSNVVMALASHEGKYATTGTPKEFWSTWKEMFSTEKEKKSWINTLVKLKNRPLPRNERTALFQERYKDVSHYFNSLEQEDQSVTEQDKLLYSLCEPARLLDLMFNFTLFDDGEKKIARYQQYFAVKKVLSRVAEKDAFGRRPGGAIWHTQGSGKSLTMVMLAQLIASHPDIINPKIVLVTDRIELDSQITDTFRKCQVPVVNAEKGASREIIRKLKGEQLGQSELERLKKDTSLIKHLSDPGDAVITTLINKFEAAVKSSLPPLTSSDIFVLVDEGHRSQYGSFHVKMQRVFPNACFIAFTGTPLMKKEKNTARKFGGIIDVYSIIDAVADGAVVPLLYEGRHNIIEVNEKPLDTYFDKVAEPLTPYGKASLKRKFSSTSQLNKADQVIYARAWDISEHYTQHVQGITFGALKAKAQLVAPNKTTAIRYREYLREINRVTAEVLISPPDVRENHDDAFEESDDLVLKFWKVMMDKYGNPETYEKSLVNAFKKQDHPEIIIVVDKLLTGFDAKNNYVLYITCQLREHRLLQAIARVNRLAPGKEHGLIIDYFGNLENLDHAMKTYAGEDGFEQQDLDGTVMKINEEAAKLPQAHSELWDIFKPVRNRYDEAAYEELLQDEALRHRFYEKLSIYSRLLHLALASYDFMSSTPDKQVDKYREDAKFFLALRVSVKRRYFDDLAFKEYEPQVQKLIDKHITTQGEVLKITELVDIFNKEQREEEVLKIKGKAARADHITSRTIRGLNIKMDEDPVFYKKLSRLIRETIEDYHQRRITEAEYLKRAEKYEQEFLSGQRNDVPERLRGKGVPLAVYNLFNEIFKDVATDQEEVAEIAERIDDIIRTNVLEDGKPVIDWVEKSDLKGKIRIEIDDYLFDYQEQQGRHLPLELIDELLEGALKVAEVKYV